MKDSIKSKVFEEGGKGVQGKGGRNFLEKVSPSLPPIRLTLPSENQREFYTASWRADSGSECPSWR